MVHLYRHLDLIHAATRNLNGNPIRTRHLTGMRRGVVDIPRGLPQDCYDAQYLNGRPHLELYLLQPEPPIGLADISSLVQGLTSRTYT